MSPSPDIRARRAPAFVLLVFFWELTWALLVATPVHAWAKRVWGAHPDGDAVLFRPGGRELSLWIASGDDATSVVIRTTVILLVAGVVIGQIPLGALVASLVRRVRAAQALAVGVRAWLPLLGVLVLAGAIEGMLLALGLFGASALDAALRDRLGDARAFGVRLAVFGLFVIFAAIVGVIADLARVAIGRHVAERDPDAEPESGLTVLRIGIRAALATSRRALGRALLAWGWRAALGLALLALGMAAGSLAGSSGGATLFAVFVAHQAVVLVRTALRASWLANALRLVAGSQRETSVR